MSVRGRNSLHRVLPALSRAMLNGGAGNRGKAGKEVGISKSFCLRFPKGIAVIFLWLVSIRSPKGEAFVPKLKQRNAGLN